MAKTPLVERMEKAGAPKTWIAEVVALQNKLEHCQQDKENYGDIIDVLVYQLQQEGFAFEDFVALEEAQDQSRFTVRPIGDNDE